MLKMSTVGVTYIANLENSWDEICQVGLLLLSTIQTWKTKKNNMQFEQEIVVASGWLWQFLSNFKEKIKFHMPNCLSAT